VFVSHVLEKYKTIREDNERLVSVNTSPDDKISSEQLNTRSPLQNDQEAFEQVKNIDSVNERRPHHKEN